MTAVRIHHVAVKVIDLVQAERFYAGVLELPVIRRWPEAEGTGDRSLWLDLGDGVFLALERATEALPAKSEDASGVHLVALGIARSERAGWIARLTEAGHPVYHQTDYTLYVRDPEGNRIGLSHWPEPI